MPPALAFCPIGRSVSRRPRRSRGRSSPRRAAPARSPGTVGRSGREPHPPALLVDARGSTNSTRPRLARAAAAVEVAEVSTLVPLPVVAAEVTAAGPAAAAEASAHRGTGSVCRAGGRTSIQPRAPDAGARRRRRRGWSSMRSKCSTWIGRAKEDVNVGSGWTHWSAIVSARINAACVEAAAA